MQTLVNTLYLMLFSIGLFVLISLGLAVIFGLMRVINLAQGEFIMLGAYVCALSSNRGVPLWLAFLLAALAVGNRAGTFDVIKSFPQRALRDTQEVCDLAANPDDTTQYEPEI